MNRSRHFVLVAFAAVIAISTLCFAQDTAGGGGAAPAVTGTGHAGHVAIWKSTTTLGSSVISQSGGNVGIGTKTPAATLEVNGDAQVDGNFSLSGSILETGVGQLLWAPNDGSGNFSAGLGALPSTTTGGGNTAVGNRALASFNPSSFVLPNTAVGNQALANNTTGGSNTAVGTSALSAISTGSSNTAVGISALQSASGNYNTALGSFAGWRLTTGDNNIYVANQGTETDSGTIRIGDVQTFTYIAGISGVNISGVPVLVSASGQLGVASSSRRFKQDIADMGSASDGLMQLRPVTFRYKQAYEDGSKPVQFGLIAEDVEQVFPDLVARSADGQVESVRYQLLDPMLLNELQKQHVTITAQKEQIRSLEERLARIETALGTSSASEAAR